MCHVQRTSASMASSWPGSRVVSGRLVCAAVAAAWDPTDGSLAATSSAMPIKSVGGRPEDALPTNLVRTLT